MITKEELKKEVDKLPENLLDEVYALLKQVLKDDKKQPLQFTNRDFKGNLDHAEVRKIAYE